MMPGIAGIISSEPAEVCKARIAVMLESMCGGRHSRTGINHVAEMGVYTGWVDREDSSLERPTPAFGHPSRGGELRTSIHDPLLGGVPERRGGFPSSQQSGISVKCYRIGEAVSLLLSGECYSSGQAALLDLYAADDSSFFEQLNGLFSGVLVDKRRNRAFLFNDRFSAERIYVHESGETLYFASEAKALLAVLPELRKFDDKGVVEFLTYGCTLDWHTLFAGIALLPGGSLWTVENKSWTKGRYFSPQSWESQSKLSAEDFSVCFRDTFKRILPRYFTGDRPVGISLTGGLDSRMILSCLPEDAAAPVCYTYTSEGETLDSKIAASVAAECGLEHRILRLNPDFFADFAGNADHTVFCTDGCSSILGSHEIYLSQKAKELSPVRLTGNYGSEILRDMSTFKPLNLDPELLIPEVRQSVQDCSRTLTRSGENPVSFAMFKEIPWSLSGSLIAARSRLVFRTPYLDNDLVALTFRAPDEVRHSTRTALELIQRNHRALAKIPTNQGILIEGSGPGYLVRRAAYTVNSKLDYYCNEGLPDGLTRLDPLLNFITQHSRFFGRHSFMHYRRWFRTVLADYIRESLHDAFTSQSPYWNPAVVQKLAEEHISGRKNRVREINAVLTLHAVERLLLHQD
jgi:asparagine synthase (glutamine-hydrolysing)